MARADHEVISRDHVASPITSMNNTDPSARGNGMISWVWPHQDWWRSATILLRVYSQWMPDALSAGQTGETSLQQRQRHET
jgi:hypothetical protein